MTVRHLDLFSGIGGFALAVRWLGGETVGFCEIEEYPQRVLAKNFPGVPIHDDIRTLTGDALGRFGRIDLLTGGYPCQPFSHAGKRLGAADDRHLWPEMRRVLNLVRPRWMLAENVAGHINMGLDAVLAELEADGYTCGAVVIPACAVNALHRRDRVWILAADTDVAGREEQWWAESAQTQLLTAERLRRGTVGSPDSSGEPGGREGQAPRSLDAGADGVSAGLVRRPAAGPAGWNDPDAIRLMWASGEWEADLPRVVAEEAGRRQKLQGAGNAIVPQVAYEVLRVMLGTDERRTA